MRTCSTTALDAPSFAATAAGEERRKMIKTMRHILKADEVTLDDPLQLGFDPMTQPPCASTGPRVRIAQNHAQYAVLEVTCSCGRKTQVRCDYGTANSSPGPQTPAQV